MNTPIHYGRNPGFKMPKSRLPDELLQELSAFTESESTDREARAAELAQLFNISVQEVLSQLEKLRKK